MWALSEMLESAQEAIFIMVRQRLLIPFVEAYRTHRIGGLPLNYICAVRPHTSRNGGSTGS